MSNKINTWDRLLGIFGVKTTWEWCVVGCMIGRHSWMVEHAKCHNLTPVNSGGFLVYYRFPDQEMAREYCQECEQIAREINVKNGYVP